MFNKQLYLWSLNSKSADEQCESGVMGGASAQIYPCVNDKGLVDKSVDDESSESPLDLVKTEVADDENASVKSEHISISCDLYESIKIEDTKFIEYDRGDGESMCADEPRWRDPSTACKAYATDDREAAYMSYTDLFEHAESFGERTKADVQRSRRANETLEQRLIRLEKDAQRKRLRRLSETDEQREARRARCAQRNRERRMCETEAERARRREQDAIRARQRRSAPFAEPGASASPPPPADGRVEVKDEALETTLLGFESEPERIAWLEEYALSRRHRRAVETPDERRARRDRDARRARERRMRESEAERAARRVADACRARVRRALETDDERRRRLARNAERKRAMRLAKSTAASVGGRIVAGNTC